MEQYIFSIYSKINNELYYVTSIYGKWYEEKRKVQAKANKKLKELKRNFPDKEFKLVLEGE